MEKQSKFITDKRSIGDKFGLKDNIKPKSTKYDSIKPTVNTGKTIKNVVLESDKLVSKKKSELFKRVNAKAIQKLLSENNLHESIYNHSINGNVVNNADLKDKTDTASVITVTSSTQIIGDLSKFTKFCIIDLRDTDEYDDYHIKDSINMPYFNISRDKFPQDMYMMKNKEDKMIICYSLDERTSIPHCQLLFQKGFDNIYLLTGGIEEFVKKFPELCEGKGISRILIELKKLEEKEKENNSKTRYKTTTISNKISTDANVNSQKVLSSKVSTVSGVSGITQKSSISALKKDLGVK